MFEPVDITPLPRRGSPLALILRGILVAAVVMALLVTLAPYAGSETQGAPPSPGLARLGAGDLGQGAGGPAKGERTSAPGLLRTRAGVFQPPEGNNHSEDSPLSIPSDRRDISGREGEAPATLTSVPPTPTLAPPTPTPTPPKSKPTSSPTPMPLQVLPTGSSKEADPVALSDLESQMWKAINGERTKLGLPPLAIDGRLVGLARERSSDMMTRGYFSHITPEGKMIFDFLEARGIYSPYAGENLARSNAEANQTVQLALSGFMNSPTHRKNVLNPHYTHLGIGEAIGPSIQDPEDPSPAWQVPGQAGSEGEGMKYFTLVFIGLP